MFNGEYTVIYPLHMYDMTSQIFKSTHTVQHILSTILVIEKISNKKGRRDALNNFVMRQMVIQFNTLPLHHTHTHTRSLSFLCLNTWISTSFHRIHTIFLRMLIYREYFEAAPKETSSLSILANSKLHIFLVQHLLHHMTQLISFDLTSILFFRKYVHLPFLHVCIRPTV